MIIVLQELLYKRCEIDYSHGGEGEFYPRVGLKRWVRIIRKRVDSGVELKLWVRIIKSVVTFGTFVVIKNWDVCKCSKKLC